VRGAIAKDAEGELVRGFVPSEACGGADFHRVAHTSGP